VLKQFGDLIKRLGDGAVNAGLIGGQAEGEFAFFQRAQGG
jgi:hypothetical protein